MTRPGRLGAAIACATCAATTACGDNNAAHVPPDAPIACAAAFTGNFTETSSFSTDCPTVTAGTAASSGDIVLGFNVPSTTLVASFGITVDLGAQPTPGAYSSETTAMWDVLAVAAVPTGACVFTAGTTNIPTGSFALQLEDIDPVDAVAHGSLVLELYVLARTNEQGMQSQCGAGTTEQLELEF